MTAPADVRTCHWHPDRVAGITCQRCERPICPQCMHQASVGFHCPECARTGAQREYRGPAAMRTRPIVTQVLIGINVVMYAAMLATTNVEPWSEGGQALWFRFREGGLFADGSLIGFLVPDEPWRLLTGGFLHSNAIPFGFIHLGFNMWLLWVLGQFLEPALGKGRFLALYFASLFGGALGVVLLSPTAITIGASGAVFGLMGAAVLVARDLRVDLWRTGLPQTLGLNLLLTFSISGISIGGHLGGLVAGGVCGVALVELARRAGPRGNVVSIVVTSVLAVALVGVSYALMASQYG